MHQAGVGPAFSRLIRLLPIGPRAKGGPALRLQTCTFNRKCLRRAGVGPKILLGVGSAAIENKNEMYRFSRLSIVMIRVFNRSNGHSFPAMRSFSIFNSGR